MSLTQSNYNQEDFSTEVPKASKSSGQSENQQFGKLKRKTLVQKSLLFQPVNNLQQRKTSVSCLEQLTKKDIVVEKQGREYIYTVYWYNIETELKHEVTLRANPNLMVNEFTYLVIQEFNQLFQNECLGIVFPLNGQKYQLFMVKKKSGKPNKDFPSFDDKVQLQKTNLTDFALVIPDRQVKIEKAVTKQEPVLNNERYKFYNQCKINTGLTVNKTTSISDTTVVSQNIPSIGQNQKKKWYIMCYSYDQQ